MFRQLTLLVIMLLGVTGCVRYQIDAPEPARANQTHHETIWVYGWGTLGEREIAEHCDITNSLASVTVHSNLAYDLLALVTIGLVRPMDVEYICSVGDAQDGSLSANSEG